LQTGLADYPFTFCINLKTKDSESRLDISQRPFQKCPEHKPGGDEPALALKGGPGSEEAHLAWLSISEKTKSTHLHNPLLETPGAQASPVPQILLWHHQAFSLVPWNVSKSTFHSVRRA